MNFTLFTNLVKKMAMEMTPVACLREPSLKEKVKALVGQLQIVKKEQESCSLSFSSRSH